MACLSAISVTAAPRGAQPTTSVPVAAGWTARFFVSPTNAESTLLGEPVPRRNNLGVNARLAKQLAPGLRLSLDVSNLFDRVPAHTEENLLAPSSGRGIRLELRRTW